MAANKNMYERATKASLLENIFVCEKCGVDALAVDDSRMIMGTRRRRKTCLECGHKTTTYEISKADFEMLLDCKNTAHYLDCKFSIKDLLKIAEHMKKENT